MESRSLPLGSLRNPGPAYVPVVLALVLLGFGALIFLLGFLRGGGKAPRLAAVGWSEWRHAVAIFLVCAFAALALERLGFRVTIALSLAFLLGVVERQGVAVTAALSIVFAGAAFFLFDTVLRVPLPRGPFGL